MPDSSLDLLTSLISSAKRAGADAADAVAIESAALSHAQRLGKVEKLERAESRDLGLRVLIGRRQAIVSTSDRDPKALRALVERAIAMARAVPEDPFCGLAPEDLVARAFPELDLDDPVEPTPEELIARARAAGADGARGQWARHAGARRHHADHRYDRRSHRAYTDSPGHAGSRRLGGDDYDQP